MYLEALYLAYRDAEFPHLLEVDELFVLLEPRGDLFDHQEVLQEETDVG
jgi:hypothetical protein